MYSSFEFSEVAYLFSGKCEKPDTGGYWIYRWIELIDHTSQKPFKVLLYRPAEVR